MKEYIVVVRKGVDLDQFWTDMETITHRCGCVPDRAVDIARDRPVFKRICEYWLTDAEAETLRADPRVLSVEIPFRNDPNTVIVSNTTQNVAGMNYNKQPGQLNFDYTTGDVTGNNASYVYPYNASTNWGLIRHSYQSDQYSGSAGDGYITGQYYNYVIDGTGVDVIINDTGLQANHPEFAGRVTVVPWDSIANTVGANTSVEWGNLSYTDTDGHGTNVAGIAAGKTYGWAKGANIIPLVLDLEFTGSSSADPLDVFEMMIYWHQTKGNNRPTVVNMSWGFSILAGTDYVGIGYYDDISGGSYRGSSWSSPQSDFQFQARGLIALIGNGLDLQSPGFLGFPYSSEAYNAALGEVIDAGIVVCQAAGNEGFKIDVPGGPDYNNYINIPDLSASPYYYHRGASPKDPRAIVVGALDTVTVGSPAQDQRVGFSCAGPGVDIWAAGTYIMSACSNTSIITNPDGSTRTIIPGAPYFRNTAGQNYREIVMTGTSQASPQVAGMSALYLQLVPPGNIYDSNNCSNVKSWLLNNATNSFYYTGNATTYTEQRSLLGGNAAVAYQNIQGLTWIKTDSNTWTAVANIHVKTDSSTWTESSNVVVKTNSTTWKPVFPVQPG